MNAVDARLFAGGAREGLHGDGFWDAAVVGAGPAGALAALHLARRGHTVLLLDRQTFPRDKVCGDALLEDALRCLERAGALEEVRTRAHALEWCAMHSPGGVEVRIRGRILTLKRAVLDDLLRARAVAAGATFAVSEVREARRAGAAYSIVLAGGRPVRARCVLLAAGAHPALAARCGFAVPPRRGIGAAVRTYLTSRSRIDRLVVCFDRTLAPGYAWIFPLGGGEFNVGCGAIHGAGAPSAVDLHAILRTFLERFPAARELNAGGASMTRPKGAMLRTALAGAEPVSPDGVLAVGETMGTTLSITGEGIGKAMESAELAAEAADRYLSSGRMDDLARYRQWVNERLAPTFRAYERGQRWLKHPWVLDLVCARGGRSRSYARLLEAVMAGDVDPSRILSVRGMIASLLP